MEVYLHNWAPWGLGGLLGAIIFLALKSFFGIFSHYVARMKIKFRRWREAKNYLWPQLSLVPASDFSLLLHYAGYRRLTPSVKIILPVGLGYFFLAAILGSRWLWFSVGTVVLAYAIVKRRADKTRQKMRAQLPDALTSVAESLRAGFTLPQALVFVSAELPRPIAAVFDALARGIKSGLGVEDCLRLVNNQLNLEVLADFSECLIAGLTSGGNLVPLINNQVAAERAELKAEAEIKSLTAAGRTSGLIIALLAPAAFLFFWFFSPDYTRAFVDTLLGKLLLGLSVILEIVGFAWIQKIVRLK